MFCWFASVAVANEPEAWVGAGLTTGAVIDGDGVGAYPTSQLEVNARMGAGQVMGRLDLDVHFDPIEAAEGPALPYPPEVAFVQLGRTHGRVRLGVTAPNFGLQEWDERDNYLPSFSTGWALQNGQNVGIEPGWAFDDGTEVFAFGGWDLAWATPSAGAGVATEQESWGTWTGAFVMPDLDYTALFTANEVYPHDLLWLTVELDGGVVAKDWFAGGQLVANLAPESIVGGAVRFDVHHATSGVEAALGVPVPPFVATAAARARPNDWLLVALSGSLAVERGGGLAPGALLLVDLHVPEPEGFDQVAPE